MVRLNRRQLLLAAAAFGGATACEAARSPQSQTERAPSGVPQRIVVLEWLLVENLLALGIQPVGVADREQYRQFVNIEATLSEEAAGVGTRQEPSLEAIAQLEPDLILGVGYRHAGIRQSLAAIAPVRLFEPYPPPEKADQLTRRRAILQAMADLTQRQERGQAVLARMQATFAQAARQLAEANLSTQAFVLAQLQPGAPQMRLFTDNALAVQVLSELGLTNAWPGSPKRFGFNTGWLDALPPVEAANFLYVAQTDNPHLSELQQNPVWQDLQFVREGHTYLLGADTWLFGGPLSAEVLARQAVKALK